MLGPAAMGRVGSRTALVGTDPKWGRQAMAPYTIGPGLMGR